MIFHVFKDINEKTLTIYDNKKNKYRKTTNNLTIKRKTDCQ